MGESLLIGLTGTFGAGKSTVARMMAECGVPVVDADEITREVTAPGGEALSEIAEAFGGEMRRADGALDRQRLAQKVFSDAKARDRLNAIVHPRVRRREMELIERYREQGAPVIVLDVPLLFETGLDDHVDRIVVVTVDDETRFARLMEKRGLSRDQIRRRLEAQEPQDRKRERADYVIDNSGPLEETRRQARELMSDLERVASESESGEPK